MDDGKSQRTSARPVYVLHRLQEGFRLRRPWENVDHPEGHGGTYTFSSATEKPVCKPESDSQNRVRRDGTVRYRERCETGLHPVSFAIQHTYVYAENIMRDVLDKWEGGVGIGGRVITNLRYADDTTLIAGTKEDLTEIMERVRKTSEKAGLYLNVLKTKVMTTGDIGEVAVDGKTVEVVTKFLFLGALITKGGLCDKEIRRRIAMGKAVMGGLTTVWKDRGITLQTKVKLVMALVFPIVLYGSETWTMRKTERKKIDAFELWCWRRVMRVSWMEIKTNVWVLENVKPKWTLESRVIKAALSYFGHVVRKERGMENDVMLGGMRGKRRRGRPRTKWLDTIKDV